jgi:hypothetical protein
VNKIDTIELLITAPDGAIIAHIVATLEYAQSGTVLKISGGYGTGNHRAERILSDNAGVTRRLAVREMQSLVDKFGAPPAIVNVERDTAGLLPTISYRCANPQCRAKLFESWGLAPGIRIVCRKCKKLNIPVPSNDKFTPPSRK